MNLKPIKPKRISDQVSEQLRELIYKGELKPGVQIPPERDLAQSMEVSRTSIRNAINQLVGMGLLEQRQGQGAFVRLPDSRNGNPFSASMATDEATLDDLLEVRLGLECNAAMLAAQRATELDLKAMWKSIEDMDEELKFTDKIAPESDVAFHMALCFAAKNPVLTHLMRNFYDFLFVGIKQSLVHLYMERQTLYDILDQHKNIYQAIVQRDSTASQEAMRMHIGYVQKYFQGKYS